MNGNLFINREENRPRAFWRLLIQVLVFLFGNLVFSLLIGIGIGAVAVSSGMDITDPQIVGGMMDHPLVRVGGAVSSLIFMFISYWVASRWLDKRPFRSFGFHLNRNWWIDFGFGLFLGAILMLIIFLVELGLGWVTITGYLQSNQAGTNFWVGILSFVIVFICVGIYEEMLSRGYQLRNLAEGFNFKSIGPRGALIIAYILSSSIFGLLHLGNANATWVSTFNIIIAGLFLGLGYVLTGELAIPIGLHITWNFFQGNVFGFPVSGSNAAATFIGIQQGGPEAWTGGAFGPEAGLIGLLAIALGCLLTVLWVCFRYGHAALKDSLAVYQAESGKMAASRQHKKPAATIQDGG